MERVKRADPAAQDAAPFYGFRSDGAIAATEHAVHRKTTATVAQLVARRRNGLESPASAAGYVTVQGCEEAFRNLDAWKGLVEMADWPMAPCHGSAEEAVKRCGRGPGSKQETLGWYVGEWRKARTGEVARLPREIEQRVADF